MVKRIFAISVTIIIFTGLLLIDKYQKNYKKAMTYARTNCQMIDLTKGDNSLFIKSNARVFLVGEDHGTFINSVVQLEFLKSTVLHHNVRYYIGEFSPSYGYMLNEYINNADRAFPDIISQPSEGTGYFACPEFTGVFRKIKQFNLSLPEEQRITIIGIDYESNIAVTKKVLGDIIGHEDAKLSTIEEAIQHNNLTDQQKSLLKRIKRGIVARKSLEKGLHYEDHYKVRDSNMFANMNDLLSSNRSENFFGQFGSNHTFKSEQHKVKWFASQIVNQYSRDIVYSIRIAYNDSTRLSFKYGVIKCTQSRLGKAFNADKEKAYFVDLHQFGTPFNKISMMNDISMINPAHDYIDAIVYTYLSEAFEPIKN